HSGIVLGKGQGAANPAFDQQWHLPVGQMTGAMTDAMSGVASDMCSCVSNTMPDLAKQGIDALVGGLGSGAQAVAGNMIDAGGRALGALGQRPGGPTVRGRGDNTVTLLANLLGMPVEDFTR